MTEEEKTEDPHGPYYAGKVYCTRCHYRWVAVSPVDTALRGGLECPRCGGMNGWLGKEDKKQVEEERDGSSEDTNGGLG